MKIILSIINMFIALMILILLTISIVIIFNHLYLFHHGASNHYDLKPTTYVTLGNYAQDETLCILTGDGHAKFEIDDMSITFVVDTCYGDKAQWTYKLREVEI